MFPDRTFRYTLKKGMSGSDVWALQLNLNLLMSDKIVEDGVWGAKTDTQVRNYQRNHGLVEDGVAGTLTQRSLALRLGLSLANASKLPVGMLAGLIEGESGWAVGCVSWNNLGTSNESVDCGWIQDNVTPDEYSDARFYDAFNGGVAIKATCEKLRARKNEYKRLHPTSSNEDLWKATVLYHNWPAGADQTAAGTFDSWKYTANYYPGLAGVDNGTFIRHNADGSDLRKYGVDTNAQWVSRWGITSVNTGRDWRRHYIETKIAYITEWTD